MIAPDPADSGPLYVIGRTEERLAYAAHEEAGRTVLLELVKQGSFYRVRGFDAGCHLGGEVTAYHHGAFSREVAAAFWRDLTGDEVTAHEIRKGRL